MIRRFKKIKKSRSIKIQPLCGEHPSWVLAYLFLGKSGGFHYKIK
jgi:hypothetical protein